MGQGSLLVTSVTSAFYVAVHCPLDISYNKRFKALLKTYMFRLGHGAL